MAKIEFVVPVYNVAEYLEKCFDSLMNQNTETEYHVFVVNDGSTDNSQEIITQYATKYSDKLTSLVKENGGLSDARNYGLQYVTAEYVIFIDSDDFVEEDMVEKVSQVIEKQDVDMVIFEYNQYFQKTDTKETIPNKFSENSKYSLKKNPELLVSIANAAWNKAYKTELFRKHNIEYPKGYRYEDLGTTYKLLLEANSIEFINSSLYNYLADRPGNITTSYDKKLYDILTMCKENIEYYQNRKEFSTYYEELKVLTLRNIMECLKKVMKMKDREFAKKFIDDCFDFIRSYFPDYQKTKYPVKIEKYDWIYLNRLFCKLYYSYVRVKNG